MRVRTLVQSGFRNFFYENNVDMLLVPSRTTVASKLTDPLDGSGAAPQARPKSRGLSGIIPAGNLAGLPAISLPCGFVDGLPIGISFVTKPFFENQIIGAGKSFQSVTDWHRREPKLAA